MNFKKVQEEVAQYVAKYFKTHHDERLVYHDLAHTEGVVEAVTEIANHYQLNEEDFFIVVTAAYFHDTGYFEDALNHEQKSAELAENFLNIHQVNQQIITAVKSTILATKMPQNPQNQLEEMLCDADLFHLGTAEFRNRGKLMHREIELIYGEKINKQEWRKQDIQFLATHRYHTDYVALLLNDQKQENLEKLKSKQLEKEKELVQINNTSEAVTELSQNTKEEDKKKDKKIGKADKPDKGIETMFRITSANNQRLSDMADNKAHILITVNSIMLSLIVSLVLRRLDEHNNLIIPTFILLAVSLSCVVVSILSTRPSIPEGVFNQSDLDNKKVNLLFFGNFYNMSLTHYTDGMLKVMNDKDFLYGTLITDVYSQGVVLGRKYKLIRLAYNIFMWGLIVAVLAFVISFVIYGKV